MKRVNKTELIISCLSAFIWMVILAGSGAAQTTAFNYQGKLTDAGNLASGTYDMQFKLFDTAAVGTGTQQGSTITNTTVQMSAGSFTVTLDFGANVFNGSARFLEISVRPSGSPNPYTVLSPRQAINSAPYAIQTVNATQLGGLPATRYVASDTNGNVGIGTVTPSTKLEVVHPASQLRFGPSAADNGGYLISRNPSEATIGGGAKWDGANWIARDMAASLTTHQNGAIQFFTNGSLSVGSPFTPTLRMQIESNGNVNIGGGGGGQARLTVGAPGFGIMHSDGEAAIISYLQPSGAALFGTLNSHPLSLITGFTPRITLDTGGKVGIGTVTPSTKLEVVDPYRQLRFGPTTADNGGYLVSTNPSQAIFAGGAKFDGANWIARDAVASLTANQDGTIQFFTNGNLSVGSPFTPTLRMQIDVNGRVVIGRPNTLGLGQLQVTTDNDVGVYGTSTNGTGVVGESETKPGVQGFSGNSPGVAGHSIFNAGVYGDSEHSYAGYFAGNVFVTGTVTQGSDARLKQNISKLGYGLPEVLRLRPVTWRWKDHPERGPQLGLVAQEVEPVLPELVSTSKDAEQMKGLNYTGLLPVLVNAIKEQQAQIEQQAHEINRLKQREQQSKQQQSQIQLRQQIKQQRDEISRLKQLVCLDHPKAVLCRESH